MLADFLVPFVVVGLAELGDKTQLSILLMSSKTKRHLPMLLGIVLAFLIVDGAAIIAGSWVTEVIPSGTLKMLSGIAFILFGLLILRDSNENEEGKSYSGNPLMSGFMLIMLTEWGDKTQVAAALFATEYNPFMVLLGTLASLTLMSAVAVYLARYISKKVDRRVMTKVAGVLFLLLGLASLLV
ncbi:MAG: TMEM165/GDT1 family protein [Candidatus Altiarchaeota archaeon]